ncbi:hypothetical protein ACFVS2_21235 [Brevibacillus sp. NPDC058079]|uniref:hypothetical protein n=1 Tax=Brevibacillus sp. NPDC058079 TaxID=3346330 RepID=UPI0036E73774
MFSKWKIRFQNKVGLEIALTRLQFLGTEFVAGRDRNVDAYFWKTQLEDAEECSDGSVGTNKAIEAFRLLYQLYLEKHGLSDDPSVEGIVASVEKEKNIDN